MPRFSADAISRRTKSLARRAAFHQAILSQFNQWGRPAPVGVHCVTCASRCFDEIDADQRMLSSREDILPWGWRR